LAFDPLPDADNAAGGSNMLLFRSVVIRQHFFCRENTEEYKLLICQMRMKRFLVILRDLLEILRGKEPD